MAPLAKSLAVAALLAAPAFAAATPKLEARQYQDPNSQLVMNEPACDFYRCYIFWVPGSQVAVNWLNPPSSGTVQIDLMTNNNSDVAYNIGTAPSISNTCDAGNGYGQPGSNGAQCGGFVFTVPSSWNAGNYSGLRAMSLQDQNLQSYTDMITITHNSSTSNDASLSIVSGSTVGGGSSTAASSSTSAAGTSSASRSSGTASMTGTSSSSAASNTGSSGSKSNGAISTSSVGATALSFVAVLAVGFGALL